MGDWILSALFLGLELHQELQEPNLETPAPSLPSEPWWPAAVPSLVPCQQQRSSLRSLWIQPLSAQVIAPVSQNAPKLLRPSQNVLDATLAPLLGLALLSTQGGNKEHFPGCGYITKVLEDPKILLVTLKPTLAKDGDRVAPCSPCPQTPVAGVLLDQRHSSQAQWLFPG